MAKGSPKLLEEQNLQCNSFQQCFCFTIKFSRKKIFEKLSPQAWRTMPAFALLQSLDWNYADTSFVFLITSYLPLFRV
jgi:hypothetical protein